MSTGRSNVSGIAKALVRPAAMGWERLISHLRGRVAPKRVVFAGDEPDALEDDTLVLLGEAGHLWALILNCPCGCGDRVHLSLHREGRPRWRVREHWDGSLSVSPSIWRKTGCKSHFFIQRGRIEWADFDDMTNTERNDRHRWPTE